MIKLILGRLSRRLDRCNRCILTLVCLILEIRDCLGGGFSAINLLCGIRVFILLAS